MPTIAVVGAGPGLGLSVARTFGAQGFAVAMVARNPERLASMVEQLQAEGVTAEGFTADVNDRDALAGAMAAAAERFGPIEVLEYSPYPGLTPVHPHEVTVENLAVQVEEVLYGAVTAVTSVLPAMLERGRGSVLVTTGGGAIDPYPMLATVNAAQAGLRNWVHNLNKALGEQGVYAATVAINVMIGDAAPEGVPHRAPDDIAAVFWDMYESRSDVERVIGA